MMLKDWAAAVFASVRKIAVIPRIARMETLLVPEVV